jgi:hypothetical protein
MDDHDTYVLMCLVAIYTRLDRNPAGAEQSTNSSHQQLHFVHTKAPGDSLVGDSLVTTSNRFKSSHVNLLVKP